jgi:hypothetical protein
MKGKLFEEPHYDFYEDTHEKVGYIIKGYNYYFLGEILRFTKAEMPFIKVLHGAIEKKCSKEVYKCLKTKKHSLKLHILSFIEIKFRQVIYPNQKYLSKRE